MTKFTKFDDSLYDYFETMTFTEDALLQELRRETEEGQEWSVMQVSAVQGQLLTLLASFVSENGSSKSRPYSAIEIGTFTGYSGICIARGLAPEAKLLSCDVSAETTRIAEKYALKAGLDQQIDHSLEPALTTMEDLKDRGVTGVDFIFIDADKTNYSRYYEFALSILRVGGMICIDNVFWSGKVADSTVTDEETKAIRDLNAMIASDARVFAATVPISDGLTVVRKK